MKINSDSIIFTDHPNEAHILAPRSWGVQGRRRAILCGELLVLDFSAEPTAGDLVLLDREMALAIYGIGVERQNVAAVVSF